MTLLAADRVTLLRMKSSLFFAVPACLAMGLQAQQPATMPAAPMHHDHAPAQPSTVLTVNLSGHSASLSLADLQALPQTTVAVHNEHTKADETYSGPLVSDVLTKAGMTLSEATQHNVLDSYVTAAGTDGYFVVFSGSELQSGLHKAQVIIAIAQSGQPLTRTGAFQLIDPLDVKPARWVRNLSALTMTPVAAAAH